MNAGEFIRGEVIKNLLSAHKRIAEHGGAKSLIVLSKFILKVSKQFNDKRFQLWPEEGKQDSEQPPEKSKQHIT